MSNLSLNKAILSGRLTKTPELKQTPQGTAVTSFTIAIDRKYSKEETDFINCVAWKQVAEHICRFFQKGNSICVVGRIQNRAWEDNYGNRRIATEVITDEVYFVDSRSNEESAAMSEAFAPNESAKTEQAELTELDPDDDLPF